MCKYCKQEKAMLECSISKFKDICLFGMEEADTLTYKEICNAFEEEQVQIFIDRGHLRLTIGDDIGCLDHSADLMKINFCPNCGDKIN